MRTKLIHITQPASAMTQRSACQSRKDELLLMISRCENTRRECETYMQGGGIDKMGALQGWMDNHCAVLDYREMIEQMERRAA